MSTSILHRQQERLCLVEEARNFILEQRRLPTLSQTYPSRLERSAGRVGGGVPCTSVRSLHMLTNASLHTRMNTHNHFESAQNLTELVPLAVVVQFHLSFNVPDEVHQNAVGKAQAVLHDLRKMANRLGMDEKREETRTWTRKARERKFVIRCMAISLGNTRCLRIVIRVVACGRSDSQLPTPSHAHTYKL